MNIYEENKFQEVFNEAWRTINGTTFQFLHCFGFINYSEIIPKLYKMGRYEECIKYIDLTSRFYQNKTDVEYYMKSFISKNDFASAKLAANVYLNTQKDTIDQEMKWCSNIFQSVKQKEYLEYLEEKCSFQDLSSQNPNFPNISGKTKLSENSNGGYKMIAQENISRGETILLEKPYASSGQAKCPKCFSDSFFRERCNCNVYYCSKQCITDHWKIHMVIHNFSYLANVEQLVIQVFLIGLQTDWSELQIVKLNKPQNDFANILLISDNFKNHAMLSDLAKISCKLLFKISSDQDFWNIIKAVIPFGRGMTEAEIKELAGQILLRILIVCEIKCVHTIDEVLGTTIELYPSLSFMETACQPNTVLCRLQDKLTLKALNDIPAGTTISYSNFEMGNLTFKEVFCKDMKLLNSKCMYSCHCQKDLDKPLDATNTYVGISNAKIKLNIFSIQLAQKIKEIKDCFSNNHSWNIHKAFELINEIQVDPNHLILQMIYFELIEDALSLNIWDNLDKYLPIVMNIDNMQFFRRNHIGLFKLLQTQMLSILYNENLPKSLFNVLMSYMEFLKTYVYLYFPNEKFLKHLEAMENICRIKNSDNFPETMKASEA